jgi:hypothetical protein
MFAMSPSVEDNLRCLDCREISTPPIYQCSNGHLICYKCIEEGTSTASSFNTPPVLPSFTSDACRSHHGVLFSRSFLPIERGAS